MQILLIITLLIYLFTIIYYNRQSKNAYEKYIQKKREEIEREISDKVNYLVNLESIIAEKQRTGRIIGEQLKEARLQRLQMDNDLKDYEAFHRNEADARVANYEFERREKVDLLINNDIAARRQAAEDAHVSFMANVKLEEDKALTELKTLQEEIESYRAKQEAINQEILRRRELEEQADFYRVCLSDEAIADVTLLQVTRQNLKKPEIIDKIIYDTYIAKPVLEMIKRVLQNTTCSGIYKITCQETKEIYIGKSTDIKNRWQQHCKTAFNCGTIASSVLHRKMQQYGIENFTFELLEKVPKDKLSEREKYYIDFYKTKETGLNERNG